MRGTKSSIKEKIKEEKSEIKKLKVIRATLKDNRRKKIKIDKQKSRNKK